MSAEAEFTEGGAARPGQRCRYCARVLMEESTAPERLLPDEAIKHCDLLACTWCRECSRGETTVSPAYRPPGEEAA